MIVVGAIDNTSNRCRRLQHEGSPAGANADRLFKPIGPISSREAARRVERDGKAVHSDITALLNAGVLDRAEGGGVVFPFEAVKVEFLLQAA